MSVTSILSMASPSSAQSCVHKRNFSSPNKDETEQQETCKNNNSPTMLAQLDKGIWKRIIYNC